MKIQLKRSNVLENNAAKEPTAPQMEYGELAVNYNTDDPAIFIKDSNNNIIRIAGVNNISDDGQVEIPSNITPPSDPLPGNLWFNPVDGRLYVYYADDNSEQWVDASPDSWNPSVIPDPDGGDNQPGTLDDRYVKKIGDNMTGNLTLGTDKITLNAENGTATFAEVIVDKEVSGGQAFLSIQNSSTDADSAAELRLFSADSGLSKFRAGIRADAGGGSDGNSQLTIRTRKGSAPVDRIVVNTDGDVLIGGTLPSAPNISLNADGSGTFGGIDLSSNNAAGVAIQSNGIIKSQRTAADAGNPVNRNLRIFGGNVETASISADGSAEFAGAVTAPNVTFNLEADDDTKYTAATNEDGEQTLVYNGAVLDVKDRLQKADAALLSLKTAAAAASDFASLKSAIVTALADI